MNYINAMDDDIDISYFKNALETWRTDIERLSAQSKESRDAVELDQTRQGRLSRQDALMQQEMAKETERRRKIDLKRIEFALKRIEDGEFGYCQSCDELIAEARLKLDPAIALCVDCAHQKNN